jgi:NAD(P)-dependent dehydrogenase (short-subunit alcohol dehydrogenase family)
VTAADLFNVAGKSALITGATGAFGKMAVETLADAGAKVTLAAGGAEALEQLGSELRDRGVAVETVPRRAETEEDAEAMVETAVAAHGGIDLVVTAAGVNKVGLATEQSPEDWQSVLDANAKGTWLVCRAAGRRMIDAGTRGKFVLVSSTRSDLGHPAGYTAYCASKAAVNLTTKALACEWGKHGINVNAIAPTVFRSPLTEWMFGDDEQAKNVRAGFLTRIPLGRLGEPEDFAGALLYFLSRASDFCTGQILYVDGGYTAG